MHIFRVPYRSSGAELCINLSFGTVLVHAYFPTSLLRKLTLEMELTSGSTLVITPLPPIDLPSRKHNFLEPKFSSITSLSTMDSFQQESKSRSSYESTSDRDDSVLLQPQRIRHNLLRNPHHRHQLFFSHLFVAFITGMLTYLITQISLRNTTNGTCYDKFNAPCKSTRSHLAKRTVTDKENQHRSPARCATYPSKTSNSSTLSGPTLPSKVLPPQPSTKHGTPSYPSGPYPPAQQT